MLKGHLNRNRRTGTEHPLLRKGGAIRRLGSLLLLFLLVAGRMASAEQKVTIEELNENLDQYIGKTVTIEGEVENVFGNRTFTLDEPGILGEDLLVVSQEPLPPELGQEDEALLLGDDPDVLVTGTVRRYVAAEIEREMGIDFDPEIEMEIEENRPVIIAKSVTEVGKEDREEGLGGAQDEAVEPIE